MRFLIGCFALFCAQLVSGQIAFHKLYSNNGYDFGHGVVQLEDSSYVICGASSSFTDGPAQAFLLHVDSLGNYIWSNHYGGTESDGARRVNYIPNSGFIAAGYTNSYGSGAYDAFAFRTDLAGNLLWETAIGGLGWERINDAVLTADTGMVMVGQTNSTPNGDNNMYVIRISSVGDTLWTRSIGGTGEDVAHSIVSLTDSTFVVGGEYFIADSNSLKGYIFGIHINGTVIWKDTLTMSGATSIHDLDYDQLGNRVNFVGWRLNPATQVKNDLFGKYFLNGIYDYSDSQASSELKIADQIVRYGTQGKNYMVYRYIDASSFQDGTDIGIIRTTPNLYWDGIVESMNYPLDDVPGQLISTSDGGAMLVGYTSGMGIGGGNVFALKIGPNDQFPTINQDPLPNDLVNVLEWEELQLKVYPIPTTNLLTIETAQSGQINFQVLDLNGQLLLNSELIGTTQLDVSTLASGIYLLSLIDPASKSTKILRFQKL